MPLANARDTLLTGPGRTYLQVDVSGNGDARGLTSSQDVPRRVVHARCVSAPAPYQRCSKRYTASSHGATFVAGGVRLQQTGKSKIASGLFAQLVENKDEGPSDFDMRRRNQSRETI
jgi:hypothetical protein